MVRIILAMAIWLASTVAFAQPVYKCTVNGKVSYGEQPCDAGTQATLALPPAPAPDPGLQERLARQKALVEKIEDERRMEATRQARASRPVPARAAAPRQQRCDKLRLNLKWAEEDLRKTAGPETEPLKLKVRRQAEALAVECSP